MDPITVTVTALAAGAAAGLKPTAEAAIKDLYASLKALIRSKYHDVDVSSLERRPDSRSKQLATAEDLADAGAAEDQELLGVARALLAKIAVHDREVATRYAVVIDLVTADEISIGDVRSEESGVIVTRTDIGGKLKIGNVESGTRAGPENP